MIGWLIVTATAAGINHLSGELIDAQRYHQALCLRDVLLQRSADFIAGFITFQLDKPEVGVMSFDVGFFNYEKFQAA